MSITFSCPHCQKSHTVKDHLTGKRAKCSGCQKVITIPAPMSLPADVEALAAAALVDEPKPVVEAPKDTRTVDFNCPNCDAELHLSVEFAGRQSQCPECRRIIKVPQLVEDKPKDWRTVQKQGPSAARRDEAPEPEGAWGTATSAKVSRQALIEADVIPQEREKLTKKQWAQRIGAGVGALAVVCGIVFSLLYFRAQSQQKKALDRALQLAASLESKSPLTAAEVHKGAGEYYLRLNTPEALPESRKHFREAHNLLATKAPATHERDYLLIELALAQVELAGDQLDVTRKARLDWEGMLKEVGETLNSLPPLAEPQQGLPIPSARVAAVREVGRKLIARGQEQQADALAGMVLQGTDARTDARREGLAQMGLELFRAGKLDAAKSLAERLEEPVAEAAADDEPMLPPVAPSLVALWVVLEQNDKIAPLKPALEPKGKLTDVALLALATGLAHQGPAKVEQARQRAAAIASPAVKLQALVAIAAAQPPADAGRDVAAAMDLIEGEFKGKGVPPWLLYQVAQLGCQTGQIERVQKLAALVPEAGVRGQMELEVVRTQVGTSKGKVEEALADSVVKPSLAYDLAHEAIAYRNAGGMAKAVDGWDESLQPFGQIGVALGLQDKGQ